MMARGRQRRRGDIYWFIPAAVLSILCAACWLASKPLSVRRFAPVLAMKLAPAAENLGSEEGREGGGVIDNYGRHTSSSTFSPPHHVFQQTPEAGGKGWPATRSQQQQQQLNAGRGDKEGNMLFSPLDVGGGWTVMVHSLHTRQKPKELDITWISQLTSDRLQTVDAMLSRWSGPVSLVFHSENVTDDVEKTLHLRARVDLHFVPAALHPGRPYPVNSLRNAAISLSRSDWFLLCDADFVPSKRSYEYLQPLLESWSKSTRPAVYVLPAFTIQKGLELPNSKEELLGLGAAATQVHPEKGREMAHNNTDYGRWRTASSPYSVAYRLPYEPYFCADKRAPRYSNEFAGYGNDKTGHVFEIARSGYEFMVLPGAFLMHVDHPPGKWAAIHPELDDRDAWGEAALTSFVYDLRAKYTDAFEPNVTAVRGLAGETCSSACKRSSGMVCSPSAAWRRPGQACRELLRLFGECRACTENEGWYGHDLPAYNGRIGTCLANGRPGEWGLKCDIAGEKTAQRMCPCQHHSQVTVTMPRWLKREGRMGWMNNPRGGSS